MSGKSRRLKDSDIRRVFHLLGEITEIGRDPSRWRLHLLQKLLPMINGRVGIIGEHFINPQNSLDTHLVGMVEWGWVPGEQERFHNHLNAGGMAKDPMHEVVPKLIFRSFTRRRPSIANSNSSAISSRASSPCGYRILMSPDTVRRTALRSRAFR